MSHKDKVIKMMRFPHHENKFSALKNLSMRLAEKEYLSSEEYIKIRKELADLLDNKNLNGSKSTKNSPNHKLYYVKKTTPKLQDSADSQIDIQAEKQHTVNLQSKEKGRSQSKYLTQQKQLIKKYKKLKEINEYITLNQQRKKLDQDFQKIPSDFKHKIKINYKKNSIKELEESVLLSPDDTQVDHETNTGKSLEIHQSRGEDKKTDLVIRDKLKHINQTSLQKHNQDYITIAQYKHIHTQERRNLFSPRLLVRASHKKHLQENRMKKQKSNRQRDEELRAQQKHIKLDLDSYAIVRKQQSISKLSVDSNELSYRVKSPKNGVPLSKSRSLKSMVHNVSIQKLDTSQQENLLDYVNAKSITDEQNKRIKEARNLKRYINEQRIKLNMQREHYYRQKCDRNKQDLSMLAEQRSKKIMQKFNSHSTSNTRGISLPAINLRKNKYYGYDEELNEWKMSPEEGELFEDALIINHEPNEKVKHF